MYLVLLILFIFSQASFASNIKNSSDNNSPPDFSFTQNIHGFFQLGTDHVWRGISFSVHSPEIFGSMLYVSSPGLYGGVIAYNTSLSRGGLGVAPIVGFKGAKNDLSYDISARYEDYPKHNTSVTPNIFEIYGELGYALSTFLKITGGIGYSPNYYFQSGTGIYAGAMVFVTLPKDFILNGGLGYQDTQKGGEPTNLWFKDYLNWAVGITKNLKNNIKIGFQYTQTNLNNIQCYDLNVCGAAYNLYIQKSF